MEGEGEDRNRKTQQLLPQNREEEVEHSAFILVREKQPEEWFFSYLSFPLCPLMPLENLSAVKLLLGARAFNDRRRIAPLGHRDASPL